MTDRIGSIPPGLRREIIAPDSDPLKDIMVARRTVVLKWIGY
jgi:hypothetical protein